MNPSQQRAAYATSSNRFSVAIMAVLFGFAFQHSLEFVRAPSGNLATLDILAFVTRILDSGPDVLRVLAFAGTLSRFYIGALRFHQNETKHRALIVHILDATGTGLLFVTFYLAAGSVASGRLLMLSMIVVHAVDALWFLATLVLRHLIKAASIAATTRRILKIYILLDLHTIIWFIICTNIWTSDDTIFLKINSTFTSVASLAIALLVDIALCWHNWYATPKKMSSTQGQP